MSCKVTIRTAEGLEASWTCNWDIIDHSNTPGEQYVQSVDVRFIPYSSWSEAPFTSEYTHILIDYGNGTRQEVGKTRFESPQALQFFIECLTTSVVDGVQQTVAKLIAPHSAGNIIRSDIVALRMVDLENVQNVKSFARPLQYFSGQLWDDSTDLLSLLASSAGGIRLKHSSSSSAALHDLESELKDRLSFPWLIPGLRRRTVAILEGSEVHPSRGGTGLNVYGAAEALGLDVVVLAVEGHWLQGSEYAHWRKAFIPIKFGVDAEFPIRIVSAIRQSGEHVEGIMTVFDCYQIAVSAAAKELGLSFEPPSAYKIVTDKYEMSAFEGHRAFKATNKEDALRIAENEDLPYPVIIKPCNGWGSEDVFKVDSAAELAEAAGRLNTERHGVDFVIEHYCDGPEVDVNIVLYDGELLFHEIADECPKSAEEGAQQSFHELDTFSPSHLPTAEQQNLLNSFHETLLRLGFSNGIFHCEARVENSLVEWRRNDEGLHEMHPREEVHDAPPSTWIIEINPRPPGMKATGIIETSYGIDYYGLAFAMALRDSARVRALSQPFRQGAQYHGDMVFISAHFDDSKAGIWQSGDVTSELLQRRPDLAKHISRCMTFFKNGDKVPHPSTGVNTYVAYFNVFSRTGREHVAKIAQAVRDNIRIEYH